MKELVMCLTEYFGRMKPLPSWLHEGAILGVQGGTSVVSIAKDDDDDYVNINYDDE